MSRSREKEISVVTIWGAVANLGLSILKMAAGFFGNSAAMVADAVHSLSDLASDVVVLVMTRIASKEKDRSHEYGHGKFETLATVIISVLLFIVGFKLMANGIEKIRYILAGGAVEFPQSIALWAALISIAIKEILYQWTSRIGKKINSQVMVSNAWHHRSDALSSVGSALGIGGAMLLGGKWIILDPLVCCIISIVIIIVAIRMILPAINELTEGSLPEETEKRILEIIGSIPEVKDVHELKTRQNGPGIIIDAHIVLDPDMRVAEAHEITVIAEESLKKEFGEDIIISLHVEPDEESE